MQTLNHKEKIQEKILEQTFINTYNFFSEYEENNGQPKFELIFLEYKDFDIVIEYFFDRLIDFLINTRNFSNLIRENNFNDCIKFFFKVINITDGRLNNKNKEKYNSLKMINEYEFNSLINEISQIKLYYYHKYIKLYNLIRDNFGSKLQNDNKIFLCPYCERNYVNVIQDKSLLIKPDLDHFYAKSKYPFLAATIDNLIPSCQVCNMRLKKEKDFYLTKHSHPLKIDENIFTKIKFARLDNEIIHINNKSELRAEEKKHIETFRIEEIYNSHKEILEDLLEKEKKYNYIKRKHILETCPSLDDKMLKDLVFHEYINMDKNKVPMSSMKRDLFNLIII